MDNPEIRSFGRWQFANGFNTALVAVKCELNKVPSAEPEWTEIFEDDEKTFPPVDEEGYSDYILISLENFTIPLIGRYRVDDKGGAFYLGDDEEPASRHDFMVNAWMPLPAPFRTKEDES